MGDRTASQCIILFKQYLMRLNKRKELGIQHQLATIKTLHRSPKSLLKIMHNRSKYQCSLYQQL